MAKVEINSAYSAQSSIAPPNPFVSRAIDHIRRNDLVSEGLSKLKVADQGCGKLRHLRTLSRYFNTIYLIDTEFQLNRRQRLFGRDDLTVREYITRNKAGGKKLIVLSNRDFGGSRLNVDIIFNVCVFDVELPRIRREMVFSARRNLKKGGLYVVIVPRNDQSILVRCTPKNRYLDGHIFQHHGTSTFFRNYADSNGLARWLERKGLRMEGDLSVHRQVCLLLRKTHRRSGGSKVVIFMSRAENAFPGRKSSVSFSKPNIRSY